MSTIHDFFTKAHRECDRWFADAEMAVEQADWATAKFAFSRFKDETLGHLEMEEDVLFPALEDRVGTLPPVIVMKIEHSEIRTLIKELEASIAQGDKDHFLATADTFVLLLQQHNMKEEQILYNLADQVMGKDGRKLVEDIRGHSAGEDAMAPRHCCGSCGG